MVCNVFDIARSSFYDYKRRRNIIDVNEIKLRAQLNACFNLSRGSAGSRTLLAMLADLDIEAAISAFSLFKLNSSDNMPLSFLSLSVLS